MRPVLEMGSLYSQDRKQYKKKPGELFIFVCCCTFADDPVDFGSGDLLDEEAERGKIER